METPQEYQEKFEERVQFYIDTAFGSREEFIRFEIHRLEQELDDLVDDPDNYTEADEATQIERMRKMNLRSRNIEFLKSQKTGVPRIAPLGGLMKLEPVEIGELAQALVSNGNWKGNRSDLIRLLAFLSGKKVDPNKITDIVKKRNNGVAKLLPYLEEALKRWQRE